MSEPSLQFHECPPTPWGGRYARLLGDSGVFHLRYSDGHLWPILLWVTEAGVVTCRAVQCAATTEMVVAITRIKRILGGEGGGSFVINEYGKVLVPASNGSGQRFLAGRIVGRLLFENPFSPSKPIDLGNREMLENGDRWLLPYIGIPYHLHRESRIYFYQQDDSGGRSIYPSRQDLELVQAIRAVRPHGAVRILVTPGGLVLTKKPSVARTVSEDQWEPVFVGVINTRVWFEEE